MLYIIIGCLILIISLYILGFSLFAISKSADENAEQLFNEMRKKNENR